MVFGRLVGWLLTAVAAVMASGDAVMALAPAEHGGIVTGTVVQLLTGGRPPAAGASLLSSSESLLMQLPAWVVVGTLGVALLVTCRKRPRRWIFRR